jgi:hypothetical protein
MYMLIQASNSIKWLYCLTLAATIFPTAFMGASNWNALATGGGLLSFGFLSLILWVAVFGYRILQVARHSTTLDAYVASKSLTILRRLGLLLMVFGLIGVIAQFFTPQIMATLFASPGPNGIGLFVVRLYVYFIASGGLLGLGLFEVTRLLGFEQTLRSAP